MKDSIVKIESIENDSFGTGFIVERDENGVFVLTCQHILDDVKKPVIDSVLASVVTQDNFLDMALLYVPKLTQSPLTLQKAPCKNKNVEIIGFSHFNHKVTQQKSISATLYPEAIELHSNDNNRHYSVHKIKVNEGFKLDRGNSGSPLICKKTKNVIAMISNKEGNDIGYAINIEQLQELWKEMPKELLNGEKRELPPKKAPSQTKEASKKSNNLFLKKILLGLAVTIGLYTFASNFNFFSPSSTNIVQYNNLDIRLKSFKRTGKTITVVLVFQNNGKKGIGIQYPYNAEKLTLTDENGKIWKLTNISAIADSFSSATTILSDGRRIISRHVFQATEEDDGKDFYMQLNYIIDGENLLFYFDHLTL